MGMSTYQLPRAVSQPRRLRVRSSFVRGFLSSFVLVLCACAQERTHPRIADVTTPVHVSVRVVDVELAKDCGSAPSFTDKVSCWFAKPARDGCTYVSVGESADLPIAFTGPPTTAHCDFQRMRSNAAILMREPRKAARIFFDAQQTRVVIHLGDEGWVLFLKDGRLQTQEQLWSAGVVATMRPLQSDDTPDWAKVPTLLSHLDAVSFDLSSSELDVLMRTDPKPEEHLRDALIRGGRLLIDVEAFDRAMKRLSPANQRLVVEGLAEQVVDGDTLAADWFRAHPEHEKLFAQSLLNAVIDGPVNDPGLLAQLLALAPDGLDTAACSALERHWHEGAIDPYYDGAAGGDGLTSALAVLVKRRVKCPWVLPLLERLQCDDALRCSPAPADDEDVEADLALDQRRPLCTDAQMAIALARNTVATKDDAEGEAVPQPSDWGPLVLAAAKLQGPLPEQLLQRNARRLYEWRYPKRTPVAEDGEEPYDACSGPELALDRWVCELPRAITRANNAGCHVEIDDAKKVLSFVGDDEPEPGLDERELNLKRPLLEPY